MKGKDFVIWLAVTIVTGGGLVFWIVTSLPKDTDIAAAVRPLAPLPIEALDTKKLEDLRNLEINGTLPVVAVPADPPRGDPFTRG